MMKGLVFLATLFLAACTVKNPDIQPSVAGVIKITYRGNTSTSQAKAQEKVMIAANQEAFKHHDLRYTLYPSLSAVATSKAILSPVTIEQLGIPMAYAYVVLHD